MATKQLIAKAADGAPPCIADRPRCPNCNKSLVPKMIAEYTSHEKTGAYWSGKYRSYGAFCTLRCGADFANAAHRAGYRRPQ